MKENFTNLWELNNFPLTDLLGTYDSSIQVFDQALTISEKNGHVQLENIIPNEILYTESDYSYRTRSSPKSSNLINFFTFFQPSIFMINFRPLSSEALFLKKSHKIRELLSFE